MFKWVAALTMLASAAHAEPVKVSYDKFTKTTTITEPLEKKQVNDVNLFTVIGFSSQKSEEVWQIILFVDYDQARGFPKVMKIIDENGIEGNLDLYSSSRSCDFRGCHNSISLRMNVNRNFVSSVPAQGREYELFGDVFKPLTLKITHAQAKALLDAVAAHPAPAATSDGHQ